MIWQKHGLLLSTNDFNSSLTHCVLPFIHSSSLTNCHYLYFSSRNQQNHASTFRLKVSFAEGIQIDHSTRELILTPGDTGFFDQHGAIGSSLIEINNKKFLYYIGWTQGHEPPLFYASIGLATSSNNGISFEKHSNAPLIPRSEVNPLLMTSPYIFKDSDNLYKMVYISGVKWERISGKLSSKYRICSAESRDALEWFNLGKVLIDFENDETNFARPWIIKLNSLYVMFYSYKSLHHEYKLGMSVSENFIDWKRLDHKISVSLGQENDFDNKMMCYPSIFVHNNTIYLFYNGNAFGKDGVGYLTADLNEFKKLVSF